MTLSLPASRAAEDFARALDGTASPQVADRYASLVATATLLREQPEPTPRPAFVAELRAQLMTAAETELVPAVRLVVDSPPARKRRSRLRERHLGAAAAAAVLIATTGGVAAAAEGSLPGDVLYPVKRGIEQVQVAMNSNDAARGAEHLRLADTRLTEVGGLLESDGTADQIASTLADYSEHAGEGSRLMFRSFQASDDADDIVAVREFTTSQVRQVEEVASLAPPTNTNDFGAIAALLSEIDQQARVLCGDCSGAAAVLAPASMLNPAAADPMSELIASPVDQAILTLRQVLPAGLGEDARQAEDTARNTPALPAPQTNPSGPTPANPASPGAPGAPGAIPSLTEVTKPLEDIVTGVTSGLPLPESVKRLTRPLTTVTEPVVDVVDDLLGSTLGGLGN